MASASERLTTVISTKGQVILPKVIRDRRRWPTGTKLVVEDTPEGVVLKPAPVFAPTRIEDVAGALGRDYQGPSLSLEDMDAAITAEARRRARR